ncbi:CPBP family intramembrane glutamic endopeptidase [Dehalogenimonas alkenigignens]|uniref:CAAX protease self-immunity n=1 Tax=Dehalogenimonas alkenigignens TaxID=1217799 RepID=A0A0W0GI65_9CHLR|nr:type II CAAX endopeptidase family protein [Dehalogenimonas alkenigignens]KTB48220.1 CAAX protease self-immunity [Dehalogenimonas alkenigignens]PVV84458.1 CPBP family intramembrane metalloprotease [Dehalogenimonas alkenigignens]
MAETGSNPFDSAGAAADAPAPASEKAIPAWGFWPTMGFSVLIGMVNAMASMLAVFIALDVALLSDPDLNWTDYIFSEFGTEFNAVIVFSIIFSGAVSLLLIGALIKARHGASIKEYLAIRPLPFGTIGKLVLLTFGLALLSGLIDTVFREAPGGSAGAVFQGVWPVFVWLAVVGVAPLFEEALFRGFMFRGFSGTRYGAALAIGLPALWWGLLHVQYGGFDQAVIVALGIILGIVRWKTGSLWGPITVHAVWNAVAMIQVSVA